MDKKIIYRTLNKVNEENVKKYFEERLFKWYFKNADEVWSDGKLLNQNEKLGYLMSNFNIKPKPKKIEYTKTQKGQELSDEIFILEEIPRLEEIVQLSKGISINRLVYIGGSIYLAYLKQLLSKSSSIEIIKNPHPSIFEDGAFDIFYKWMKDSKEDEIKTISFIFQKLKKDNLLRKTGAKELLKWCYEHNFINKSNYDNMIVQGYLTSPSKILTSGRLGRYNTMIKDHFPNFGKNMP